MTKSILIAGGSGMIGMALATRLASQGHEIRLLSRRPEEVKKYKAYAWDLQRQSIDHRAFEDVDIVINLAGAGIADKLWTSARRKVLTESRVKGNQLLAGALASHSVRPELFIGASAVGIYGDRGEELLTESSAPGSPDFMVRLCEQWEESQSPFRQLCERTVTTRIGVVLSNQGGALPRLSQTIILGIGGYLGSGKQYVPWVHLDDLVRMFEYLIENPSLAGTYNAVSPAPVTHYEMMRAVASNKIGPGWLFPVPAFLVRLVLGEMSKVLLNSNRVIPKRLLDSNYQFRYSTLETALQDLQR